MTLRINIGEDSGNLNLPKSTHILNLKTGASSKTVENRGFDLKDEIRNTESKPGKLVIVGDQPREKRGMGRIPVIMGALMVVMLLNMGQLFFVGSSRGKEALVLASQAVVQLKDAGKSFLSGQPGSEQDSLDQAGLLFAEAQDKASFLIGANSPWLSEPQQVRSLRNLLQAGTVMSELGTHLSETRKALTDLPKDGSLTEYLKKVSADHLEPADTMLVNLNKSLEDVDLSGTPYAADFETYKQTLNALQALLDEWVKAKDSVLTMLGDRYPQQYLLLLMNNDEPRLGGGFIGSVGLLMMNDGRIQSLEFRDVYDYDNLLFENIPVPQHELRGLTENWRLRDSNTSLNFPSSAQNAMKLFEKEAGQSVDGVIAIHANVAQTILQATGPIKAEGLKSELTAENFPSVMSTLVEAKVAGAQPKKILFSFIQTVIDQLKSKSDVRVALGAKILNEVKKKQILFYHNDSKVMSVLNDLKLSAAMPKLGTVDHDFVALGMTNMGGNKTERSMKTNLSHETTLTPDGTVLNTLTLSRKHSWNDASTLWLKNEMRKFGFTAWNKDLEALVGAGVNHTGIRIYVPEGVNILDVSGDVLRDELQFKYDPDQDLSYYFWDSTVESGQEQVLTMSYSLPKSLDGDFTEYHFGAFKQPGFSGIQFEKTVLSQDRALVSTTQAATEPRDGADYVWKGILDRDLDFKLLYK